MGALYYKQRTGPEKRTQPAGPHGAQHHTRLPSDIQGKPEGCRMPQRQGELGETRLRQDQSSETPG